MDDGRYLWPGRDSLEQDKSFLRRGGRRGSPELRGKIPLRQDLVEGDIQERSSRWVRDDGQRLAARGEGLLIPEGGRRGLNSPRRGSPPFRGGRDDRLGQRGCEEPYKRERSSSPNKGLTRRDPRSQVGRPFDKIHSMLTLHLPISSYHIAVGLTL